MSITDDTGLGLVLIFGIVATALWIWTPLDVNTSTILAGVLVVLLTVPRQSIVEGVRFLENITGAHRLWWALFVIAFLIVMNGTQYLGAPEVLLERPHNRASPRPTRYGIGTVALFAGGFLLLLVSNYMSALRTLRQQLPFEAPSSGWMTLEGVARPDEEPLQTPIEGAPALWYRYQVTKEQDGLFQWPRLPVASTAPSVDR